MVTKAKKRPDGGSGDPPEATPFESGGELKMSKYGIITGDRARRIRSCREAAVYNRVENIVARDLHVMNPNPVARMTPEEFLAFERPANEKHEYRDWLIVDVSGAKRNHNIIALNLGGEIQRSLKGKECEGYPSDMRVFVPASNLYTYPDLVVACGEPVFQDEVLDTLLNPLLIIEILSESTESYDRGQKFQNYRSIDSLREYVLVSQTSANIEKYGKHGDGFWMHSEASGLDSNVTLETISCPLSLTDVYDKVNFGAE